jgi:aminotransferase
MNGSKSRPETVAGARSGYVAPYLRDIPRSGIRDFFDIVSSRKDVISLGIGEPDFATPWHIREAAIFALDRGATTYTSNRGLFSLRKAIAAYVHRAFGVPYDPESEILITVGVSEALDLAIRALVQPGDEVIYHEPCYVSYRPVILFAHATPVAVDTRMADGFRLTGAMVEARITARTKALVLNFPTNPTGATMTRADLEGIAAVAIRHDLIVITDEIYSELTYEGERVSIASLPGMQSRTIFLHGFSKGWAMTGFRLGYACSPPELSEAMMKIHQYTMLCAPILSQVAAEESLRTARDTEEMRAAYAQRRNFLWRAFQDMRLPCFKPQGAFYMFPDISGCGIPSRDFALRLLDEENVACVPGSAFGGCGEGFLRCSYATDLEEIKEAVARLTSFVQRLRKA